jgi:O-antigen ligase
VALAFVVLLLILATTSQGAFAVSRWAPLALLTLAVLIGTVVIYGRIPIMNRRIAVALAGIWGLAAWSILSMLWASSKGDAWIGGLRSVLYAAIVTMPFILPMSRRTLARAGWAVSVGIGLVGVYTLIRLLIDGSPMFLAGRLNGPINYRNATALLFALPVWPMVMAAAARDNQRSIRAGALSLATMCLGLAFLTQSRGILLGLALGGILAVAVGPERVRRIWTAVLVLGGVALASHWLLRPYHVFDGGKGLATQHDIAVAAQALTVVTVLAFVVGVLIALFDAGLRPGSPGMRQVHRAARIALVIGVLVAIGGGLAVTGNPITYVHRKWDQFRATNGTASTNIRLLSTGGQRYDLWRVALKEFDGAPILGVGADNYLFGYYKYRRTNRNLDAPHSFVFSLLSETGIVGALLFALFLGGIAATMRSRWRELGPRTRRDALAPAVAGVVLIGQSAVDWIWLIPGLTAIGLFMLSVAAAQVAVPADESPTVGARRLSLPVRAAVALPLLAVALCVLSLYLSDAYIQRARSVTSSPAAELSAAKTAGTFNPWSVTPHYLEAAVYETMGKRVKADSQLRHALSLEPKNAATLGVLGDFEARSGKIAAARSYYRRALALDPLDTGLQQLARIGLRSNAAHRASR